MSFTPDITLAQSRAARGKWAAIAVSQLLDESSDQRSILSRLMTSFRDLCGDRRAFDIAMQHFPFPFVFHLITDGATDDIKRAALSVFSFASLHRSFPANEYCQPGALELFVGLLSSSSTIPTLRILGRIARARPDVRDFLLQNSVLSSVGGDLDAAKAAFVADCMWPKALIPPDSQWDVLLIATAYLHSGQLLLVQPFLKLFRRRPEVLWDVDLFYHAVFHEIARTDHVPVARLIVNIVEAAYGQLGDRFHERMPPEEHLALIVDFFERFADLQLQCMLVRAVVRHRDKFQDLYVHPICEGFLETAEQCPYLLAKEVCKLLITCSDFAKTKDIRVVTQAVRFISDPLMRTVVMEYFAGLLGGALADDAEVAVVEALLPAVDELAALEEGENEAAATLARMLMEKIAHE